MTNDIQNIRNDKLRIVYRPLKNKMKKMTMPLSTLRGPLPPDLTEFLIRKSLVHVTYILFSDISERRTLSRGS